MNLLKRSQKAYSAITSNRICASFCCTLSPAEPATLLQILLVVLLRRPELCSLCNFCDRSWHFAHLFLCNALLFIGVVIDSRSVLCAYVIALSILCSGIVVRVEYITQLSKLTTSGLYVICTASVCPVAPE